ncbi:MAG TPA: SagB/ThcOx family dehydrogenase [Candidatus Edwardsbacteria bacterium]|nr:SagB/ThcOx family dehydrogenase [Candidatus Edwardsbacteria bacterium]
MQILVKRIARLSKIEKRYFIDALFDPGEDAVNGVIGTIKRWDADQRETFIKTFPMPGYEEWFRAQLEKVPAADDKEKARIEHTMAAALKAVPIRVRKAERNMAATAKRVMDNRRLLRSDFAALDGVISDQQRGKQRPPVQQPYPKGGPVVELPKPDRSTVINNSLYDCIAGRQSRRKYKEHPLSQAELSYLLWATQGVRRVSNDGRMTMRTVPSAGSMHPFETYVAVHNVDGVKPGLYRYQAADHRLAFLRQIKDQQDAIGRANLGQSFVGHCAATFFWAAAPYKTEWRYVTESAKLILLDAGHVCQNFYLACESIGCGTCGIGAYDQDMVDKLLKLDRKRELVVYLAPVGKV